MTTADYFRVQDRKLAEHWDALCLHTRPSAAQLHN
jgi:predicted SnoaL-like aldol condensation-catalyzing enzyme